MKITAPVKRLLGLLSFLEGLALLTLGRAYPRMRARHLRGPARGLALGASRRSSGTLRALGLLEAAAGLALLHQTPIAPEQLYASLAPVYDGLLGTLGQRSYAEALALLDRHLQTDLAPRGSVLDLGCGTGANLARLLKANPRFGSYTGFDLSDAMLDQARRRYDEELRAEFVQGDMAHDPLPQGPFDLILAKWSLEHLADPVPVVQRAWRELRPGGHMLLLFFERTGSPSSRVYDWIYRIEDAHMLRKNEYLRFPGLESVSRFKGAFGPMALAVLHRPSRGEREALRGWPD